VTTFEWDDTQTQLIDLVETICRKHLDWADYLGQENPGDVDHSAVWKMLIDDVGLRGLAVPGSDGGHGASWKTVGAVVYALAGHVTAVPFLSQWVSTESLLGGLGDQPLTSAYLAGEFIPCIGVPAGMPSHDFRPTLTLDGDRLSGTLSGVLAPVGATDFVVLAQQDVHVLLVRTAVNTATMTPISSIDLTRPQVDVEFRGAPAVVLGRGVDVQSLWGSTVEVLEVMVSVELAGLAASLLNDAVQYSTERVQFGRPICTNQAVRHQLADVWINVQEAQSVSMYALNCLTDAGSDLPVAICMARSFCADAARRTSEAAVQIRGGMGFAWETSVHLGLKRAIASALWLGAPGTYRRRLRELVDL
jgi:alkylation response protein AidB-like acyl-CoA dehydrogenase